MSKICNCMRLAKGIWPALRAKTMLWRSPSTKSSSAAATSCPQPASARNSKAHRKGNQLRQIERSRWTANSQDLRLFKSSSRFSSTTIGIRIGRRIGSNQHPGHIPFTRGAGATGRSSGGRCPIRRRRDAVIGTEEVSAHFDQRAGGVAQMAKAAGTSSARTRFRG